MGGAYLPVDTSWEQYISDVEYTYEDMEGEMKSKLMALADNACSFMHNKRWVAMVTPYSSSRISIGG